MRLTEQCLRLAESEPPGLTRGPVLSAAAEVLGEETFGLRIELEAVLRTGEAMAFVLEEQVLVVYALFTKGGDYLLGLGPLDARVIRSLGDEKGYLYLVHVEERGAGLKELLLGVGVAYPLVEGG